MLEIQMLLRIRSKQSKAFLESFKIMMIETPSRPETREERDEMINESSEAERSGENV